MLTPMRQRPNRTALVGSQEKKEKADVLFVFCTLVVLEAIPVLSVW